MRSGISGRVLAEGAKVLLLEAKVWDRFMWRGLSGSTQDLISVVNLGISLEMYSETGKARQ